jgi:hypothetical protein
VSEFGPSGPPPLVMEICAFRLASLFDEQLTGGKFIRLCQHCRRHWCWRGWACHCPYLVERWVRRPGPDQRQVSWGRVGKAARLSRPDNQQVRSFPCYLVFSMFTRPFPSVHGEFRFSALPMPPPSNASKTGGRLSGEDMCNYMERYANTYLKGKIKFEVEVLNIRRSADGCWNVRVKNANGTVNDLEYARVVLCTGVS